MLDIPRANPYLQPILDDLHNHYLSCKGDVDLAFNRLPKADQEWIDQELLHCMVDPRYYLENYHAVKTEQEGIKGLYPFWESQDIFYREIESIKKLKGIVKLLVLKARQQGLSTISEGMIFHKTIFTEACNALIVAQDGDQAGFLFEMSRTAYDYLPWWMRPEKRYEQAGKLMAFDRVDEAVRQARPGLKSNIFVEAANKPSGAARGKTVRTLHCSELAFWDDGGQLTKSIFPTMNADDTLAIMESTANGRSGFFYEFWKKTMDGKTDWNPLFIEFFRVKKYSRPLNKGVEWTLDKEELSLKEKIKSTTGHEILDETFNWMRMKKEEFIATDGDEFMFYQEYPATPLEAFQGTGNCAFPKRKLQNILANCRYPTWIGEIRLDADNPRKPRVKLRSLEVGKTLHNPETEDRLYVWERPEADETYYVAADVAMGNTGGDFSCVEVMKIGKGLEPDVQVCEWRGWINPTPYASVIAALGYWYNEAQIAVEVNSVGIATNNELMRGLEYDNIFRWKHLDSITHFLTDKSGWYTQSKSRDSIIAKMIEAVEDNSIVINSEWLVDEMLDFSQDEDGGKFEGQDTHDDRVMAMMICHYCAHDSDWGKQAASKPMSRSKATGVLIVRDKLDRQIYRGSDRSEAETWLKRNKGSSISQALEAADYQNTAFSPVHDGTGTASRMHREHGYQAEDIDRTAVAEFEESEEAPDDDDPEAWKWY